MKAVIQVEKLFKKYPGGVEALKGVCIQIDRGDFFALLGPNGAGKSTLVKILTTLLRKDAGSVLIEGKDNEKHFAKIQTVIGVASQENELDPSETVEGLLRFQCRLFGMTRKQADQRTQELIDLFNLDAGKGKKAEMLSGGNKRRLHCALALVHQPRILFLDEPTVGMDPEARANFWQIIRELNQKEGTTIFLTTQYLEEADRYASKMALILDGEIRYDGSISNFKKQVSPGTDKSLDESYLEYIKQFNGQLIQK